MHPQPTGHCHSTKKHCLHFSPIGRPRAGRDPLTMLAQSRLMNGFPPARERQLFLNLMAASLLGIKLNPIEFRIEDNLIYST